MTYILAQSVLLAWLYNSTRASLAIAILFHAAFNSFTTFFLSELDGLANLVAWWTLAGLCALLALAVVRYAGSRSLVRSDVNAVGRPSEAR